MSDEQQAKPKIIVDDDWKERVQAEKEELQKEKEAKQRRKVSAQAGAPPPGALPPASFAMLVTSLATQALAALGQVPDPVEGNPLVRLDLAKHTIDTLGILEDKTKGNLNKQESEMLAGVLHELRMLYVTVRNRPAPAPSGTSEPTGNSASK